LRDKVHFDPLNLNLTFYLSSLKDMEGTAVMEDMAEDMVVMEETMTMDMVEEVEVDMEGIIEGLDGAVLGNLRS